MQGTLHPSLSIENSPMIYDWNIASINLDDTSTWLPMNALPLDLIIHKVLKSGISLRDRHKFWPKIFQTGGHIITDRLNMGTAANVASKSTVKDMSSIEVCTSCTAISVPNEAARGILKRRDRRGQ